MSREMIETLREKFPECCFLTHNMQHVEISTWFASFNTIYGVTKWNNKVPVVIDCDFDITHLIIEEAKVLELLFI